MSLQPVLRAHSLPREPFARLIEANRVDQRVSRYQTWEELRGYCRLSADPVGELVLGVFDAADAARVELSDSICTGLQLTEHLQDVAEDHASGRIYIPLEDLTRFGAGEQDVAAASASPAVARGDRLRGRAGAWPAVGRAAAGRSAAAAGRLRRRGLHRRRAGGAERRSNAPTTTCWRARRGRARPVPGHARADARRARPAPAAEMSELADSYARCEAITRTRGGELLLRHPPAAPEIAGAALCAAYAFARRIDDIGDGDLAGEEKLARLEQAEAAAARARRQRRPAVTPCWSP